MLNLKLFIYLFKKYFQTQNFNNYTENVMKNFRHFSNATDNFKIIPLKYHFVLSFESVKRPNETFREFLLLSNLIWNIQRRGNSFRYCFV
jgi:hypothetical protein